ncbi:hypothetical protein M501DRAFT_833499 [Patellaria atrata CBS 101060]|uniref:Uncharacterized protein n=1 Tax=Patellaria atrata CBS 101060 TaxID=1346257 RepID=A0A9P4SBH1_9PEZI|nr:hypothetical protein M501DRAFT_833499 [Patellaria atrata CBS 101060]
MRRLPLSILSNVLLINHKSLSSKSRNDLQYYSSNYNNHINSTTNALGDNAQRRIWPTYTFPRTATTNFHLRRTPAPLYISSPSLTLYLYSANPVYPLSHTPTPISITVQGSKQNIRSPAPKPSRQLYTVPHTELFLNGYISSNTPNLYTPHLQNMSTFKDEWTQILELKEALF